MKVILSICKEHNKKQKTKKNHLYKVKVNLPRRKIEKMQADIIQTM